MFDLVTEPLSDLAFDTLKIAIICDKEKHIERMIIDGRRSEQANTPDFTDKYLKLGANIIDTTSLTINEEVRIALNIIDK